MIYIWLLLKVSAYNISIGHQESWQGSRDQEGQDEDRSQEGSSLTSSFICVLEFGTCQWSKKKNIK